ncbi:hypothetical protein EV426DRAFT_582791 [Tirmania nivea]|nr:hypothetical protein EV426DRAFT_582791 [Tirmania nivea]
MGQGGPTLLAHICSHDIYYAFRPADRQDTPTIATKYSTLSTINMSTKIFILSLQIPWSTASPKDYILVLNKQLTPDEFIADLRELYPDIPTTDGMLGLALEGTDSMTPRQFLRYMRTTVAYTPKVEGGVCVPKLLGRGNGVTIVYGQGLAQSEPTQPITGHPTHLGELASQLDVMKIGENFEPSASNRANLKRNETQSRSHPPSHENASHAMYIILMQNGSTPPRIRFEDFWLQNVPRCGGRQESIWLKSEILARLPDWLDPSTVQLDFSTDVFDSVSIIDSHITWNEDSFYWSENTKRWRLTITVKISW